MRCTSTMFLKITSNHRLHLYFLASLLVLNCHTPPAGTMCCTSQKELNILVISAGLLLAACCWLGLLSTPPWPKESSHRERLEDTHTGLTHTQATQTTTTPVQLIRRTIRQEVEEEKEKFVHPYFITPQLDNPLGRHFHT